MQESLQPDRNSFVPLYHQLRMWIEEQIKRGVYPPGALLPSDRELCERFNVSTITVRRALRELVLAGLVYRQASIGTFVSPVIRRLRLALVVVGFDEIWWRRRGVTFSNLVGGIGKVAWEQGAQLTMAHLSSDEDLQTFIARVTDERSFDGLLLRPKITVPARHIGVLEQRSLPYVIARSHLLDRAANCVIPADEEDVYLATRHLIQLGHRRIAYAGGPRDWPICADRLRGYRRALEEGRIAWNEALVREGDDLQSGDATGRETIVELLRAEHSPSAIVVGTSALLPWVYRAIDDESLRIPDDISVVTSDEELASSNLVPTPTRFGPNHYDIGVQATRALIQMIEEGMGGPREIVLPPTFRVGGSTARFAGIPNVAS